MIVYAEKRMIDDLMKKLYAVRKDDKDASYRLAALLTDDLRLLFYANFPGYAYTFTCPQGQKLRQCPCQIKTVEPRTPQNRVFIFSGAGYNFSFIGQLLLRLLQS